MIKQVPKWAGDNLAKGVDAAVSIRSNKDSIQEIGKNRYRPENCKLLSVPRVNKEVWEVVPKVAHSSDVYLQEVQRSIATGLIPITCIEIANQLVKKEPLDTSKAKCQLSDSLSLLGHAFYNISMT